MTRLDALPADPHRVILAHVYEPLGRQATAFILDPYRCIAYMCEQSMRYYQAELPDLLSVSQYIFTTVSRPSMRDFI